MPLLAPKQQQDPLAPLPRWKPRKTIMDLYVKRDRTQWYWRTAAMLSAAFIMIGFLLFPRSFPRDQADGVNSIGPGIAAGLLLALGYITSAIAALACKNWLFQMDVVFVPCFFSSLLGLINIAIAFGDDNRKKSIWSASSLAAVGLASISTATYLVLTLHTFRRIHIVRNRDAMHRPHSDGESYHLLPEDEMQRQQLLRLLVQRENDKKPSPDASQSTFHIDLPANIRRIETHLTTPRHAHAHATRENDSRDRGTTFTLPSFSPLSSMRVSSPYQAVATHDRQPSPPALQHRQSPPISQHHHSPPAQPPSQIGHQTVERNFSESSRAPPYSALSSHGSIRYPTEKEKNARYTLDGEIHPLEREREQEADKESKRPQFHIVESSPVQDLGKLMQPGRGEGREGNRGDVRRQRSTSRESRRAEIELERDKVVVKRGEGQEDRRAELGAKVSPRIMRVETDGWGKK